MRRNRDSASESAIFECFRKQYRHILQEKSKKLSVIFAVSKKKSTFVLDFGVTNDTKIE